MSILWGQGEHEWPLLLLLLLSVAAKKLHRWIKLFLSDPVEKIMLCHTIPGMYQNNIIKIT